MVSRSLVPLHSTVSRTGFVLVENSCFQWQRMLKKILKWLSGHISKTQSCRISHYLIFNITLIFNHTTFTTHCITAFKLNYQLKCTWASDSRANLALSSANIAASNTASMYTSSITYTTQQSTASSTQDSKLFWYYIPKIHQSIFALWEQSWLWKADSD